MGFIWVDTGRQREGTLLLIKDLGCGRTRFLGKMGGLKAWGGCRLVVALPAAASPLGSRPAAQVLLQRASILAGDPRVPRPTKVAAGQRSEPKSNPKSSSLPRALPAYRSRVCGRRAPWLSATGSSQSLVWRFSFFFFLFTPGRANYKEFN